MSAAEDLREVLASAGTERIGALVFWSLESVDIERDKFREELKQLGLEDAMGKDPSAQALISDAVRANMSRRKHLFARRVGKGYGIVAESSQLAPELKRSVLKHEHLLTVEASADKEDLDQELLISYPEGEQHAKDTLYALGESNLITSLRDTFDHSLTHFGTSELSDYLVTMLSGTYKKPLLSAISLRERSGGLYFVPAAHVDNALAVSALLRVYTLRSAFNVFAITGQSENLSQAAQAAKRGFTNQLNELRQEIVEYRESLKLRKSVATERTLAVRYKRFGQLRDRVALFRDVLGDVSAELERKIVETRDACLADLEAV